jgi:HEAT repeat protein
VSLLGLNSTYSPAAEEEPGDPLVDMVVELLGDADRDMRALGLQQVREEVPGEAATRRFVALLPELAADGRAALLEALGERGDATARPTVLEMLKADDEAVRAAAVRALGGLGNESDVPLLAQRAGTGSEAERAASLESLIRLKAEGVTAAIVAAMADGDPGVRVALLDVLASRNAKEALPTVLERAGDGDASVRLAALGALRYLADETHITEVVNTLKETQDEADRRKAELALLVVCSRGREKCVEAIISGMAGTDPPTRISLMHGLARAGGTTSLETLVKCLEDDDEAVRDEAVRMLSIWPDAAVAPQLMQFAKTDENLRYHVLAIRGLARLASPQEDKPADLKMLAEVLDLAKRPQEKRLVLGVLGGVADPEAMGLVLPVLEDASLAEEAGLAAVMIAERIQDGSKDEIRTAMEKVLESASNQDTRQRAKKAVDSL